MRLLPVSSKNLQRIPLLVGFFLSLLTALGGWSLIESIKSHDKEQLAFELFRASVEILDSLSEEYTSDELSEYVKGFVLLGGRGEVIQSSGQWESSLRVEVPNGYWRVGNLIVYHRQVSGGGGVPGLRESPGSGRQMVLWYDPTSFELGLQQRNLTLYFGLLLLSGLMILAGFLTRQLYTYQTRLASQGRLALLGQVARTISHEIQNPLAALDLHRQLADKKADPTVQPHLDVIKQESQRITEIITHVRQLINPNSAESVDIDLVEWVEHFIRTFVYSSMDSNQSTTSSEPPWPSQFFHFDHPDSFRPTVHLPVQHLETMVTNLVINGLQSQNSIKLSKPLVLRVSLVQNSWPLSLRFRARSFNNVALDIIDQGPGLTISQGTWAIDPMEQLFDPFYTTKIHGTGLGLALSRNIARQAGGDIRLIFPKGGGCKARLLLPRVHSA